MTSWYPTSKEPGRGVFVREHAKAAQLYDDVMVLHCAEPVAGLTAPWQLQQETDERLTEGIVTYRSCYRISPIPKTSYLVYLQGVFRAYRHIVATGFRPDVLHAHIYEAGVPAVLLGKIFGLPVVITEHFSAFPRRTLGRLEVLKARFAFGAANRVLPVSMALQKGIERYGIRARFRVVPNAVDVSLFFPPSEPATTSDIKQLLFVGALIPLKGLDHLLRALGQLRQTRSDWRLSVVGDGPQRLEYEHLALELGLADNVTFEGYLPKPAVAESMRRHDLLVHPSLWENLPCVLVEALASGLRIVATSVGGIPEIVTAATSVLVPPGDVARLSQAIEQSLRRLAPGQRAAIAKEAQQFSMENVGRTLHEIYESTQR